MLERVAIKFEIRAALELQGDSFLRANGSANADVVLALDEALLR